jgi:hypothetical protein
MAKTAALKKCIDCSKEDYSNSILFSKAGNGRCNRCSKIEWEKNNPIKLRAQRLQGNTTKRAKTRGWPKPDFNTEYIYNKIKEGYCEITGIKFDLETETKKSLHTKNPWVPSIDRIDSSKPYLKDNIKIVIFMYNVCKSEFTHEDVVTFCKAVKEKEDDKT